MANPTQTYVLLADRLRVSFGGVIALDLDHLELPDSENVGAILMGTNGAGKTTLLDAISGFVATTRDASLRLRSSDTDQQLSRASRFARVRAGVVRTFQHPPVFPSLTVGETLSIPRQATTPQRGRLAQADRQREICNALKILDALDRKTSTLPLHVLRRVEIARLLGTEPRLLLLDEPTAGCDDSERLRLTDLLTRTLPNLVAHLHADGAYRFPRLTTAAVTHDLKFARQLSDVHPGLPVNFFRGGRLQVSGRLSEIETNADLRATYFGGAVHA